MDNFNAQLENIMLRYALHSLNAKKESMWCYCIYYALNGTRRDATGQDIMKKNICAWPAQINVNIETHCLPCLAAVVIRPTNINMKAKA